MQRRYVGHPPRNRAGRHLHHRDTEDDWRVHGLHDLKAWYPAGQVEMNVGIGKGGALRTKDSG